MIWIAIPWCLSVLLGILLALTWLDLRAEQERADRTTLSALEIMDVLAREVNRHG